MFRNKSSAFSRHQNSNTKILDYLTPFEEYQVKTYNSSELKDLAESIPFQAAIKNLGRLFESNEIELMFTNGTNIPMIGPVKKSSMRSQELIGPNQVDEWSGFFDCARAEPIFPSRI